MDAKLRDRIRLNCLYDMFRDRIEENVIYIVFSENDGKIDATVDQLMLIASCSFTGHQFEPKPVLTQATNHSKTASRDGLPNISESLTRVSKTSKELSKRNSKHGDTDQADDNPDEDETALSVQDRIERLQKSINDLLLEKQSSHDKASLYLSKKMYTVTSYYSELGSQLRKMIEDKTNQLVDLLIEKSSDSDHIDLHGLNPVQARLVVNELLRIRQNKLLIDKQGEASVDIITGWGRHSLTHGHKIRPTIVALLREKGFEYHHLNRGALRVTIRR